MCGWGRQGAVVPQNNWLFTQHISKAFDASTYNYDVAIQVEAIYSLQSCRERQGCKQRFNLLHYMTNSQQLPSTEGDGYMNTQNYVNFAVPEGEPSVNKNNTYTFTLPPSSTGFYIALQDIGSCIALSRLRVYHNSCKSRRVGLVLYPDAPTPVSGTANIRVTCVENAVFQENALVVTAMCNSSGYWVGEENPVCECKLGHEEREEDGVKLCVGKLPEYIVCCFSVDLNFLCITLGNNLGYVILRGKERKWRNNLSYVGRNSLTILLV